MHIDCDIFELIKNNVKWLCTTISVVPQLVEIDKIILLRNINLLAPK